MKTVWDQKIYDSEVFIWTILLVEIITNTLVHNLRQFKEIFIMTHIGFLKKN